ncbi:MAG: YvaD family protein [Sphingomonas sp.]|uniref:DUF5360 family protein n=1 Tax=Sphingomonas sp. TaxID=28214 RepID=UPI0035A8D1D0|nr:YvaD family protein [Sphingomonas sp.]
MVADLTMPRGLPLTLRVLDASMLFYWGIATLACAGLLHLPQEMMYAGYGTEQVDAWNWSFAPLDLAFALTGLLAVRIARRSDPRWRPVALISLALTFCAGLMAISYWALTGDFDPAWWLPNLALIGAALWWLPRLVGSRG